MFVSTQEMNSSDDNKAVCVPKAVIAFCKSSRDRDARAIATPGKTCQIFLEKISYPAANQIFVVFASVKFTYLHTYVCHVTSIQNIRS